MYSTYKVGFFFEWSISIIDYSFNIQCNILTNSDSIQLESI